MHFIYRCIHKHIHTHILKQTEINIHLFIYPHVHNRTHTWMNTFYPYICVDMTFHAIALYRIQRGLHSEMIIWYEYITKSKYEDFVPLFWHTLSSQ